MILKLTDNQINQIKSKDNLIKLLEESGNKLDKLKANKWRTSDEKIILKSSEFFNHFKITNKKTSIKPWYVIVDEKIKRIIILHIRTQIGSGSTYQKLPYGGFIVNDYSKEYKNELFDYDIQVGFIINSYWRKKEKMYGNLISYIKNELGILIWENEIRI